MKTLSMEIKLARTRMKLSQKMLAEKMGITTCAFVTLENKKERLENMSLKKFIKLCGVLDEEFRSTVLDRNYLLTMFKLQE